LPDDAAMGRLRTDGTSNEMRRKYSPYNYEIIINGTILGRNI
jgi:hypothetical protein